MIDDTVIECTRCDECGFTRRTPWKTCARCATVPGPVRDAYNAELRGYRAAALRSLFIDADPYSDSMLVYVPARELVVSVDGETVYIGRRLHGSALRDDLGMKDAEIKELLVENARLRRDLERAGRRR